MTLPKHAPGWNLRANPYHVFYVSIVSDTGRRGVLLGPYETMNEAKSNITRGKRLADEADCRAAFYSFGTCSAPRNHLLRPVFGV